MDPTHVPTKHAKLAKRKREPKNKVAAPYTPFENNHNHWVSPTLLYHQEKEESKEEIVTHHGHDKISSTKHLKHQATFGFHTHANLYEPYVNIIPFSFLNV